MRLKRVSAGLDEDVGQRTFIYKRGSLTFADDQLRAVFDFVIAAWEPPDDRVARIVEPFNDVDQFVFQFIEDAHGSLRFGSIIMNGRRCSYNSHRFSHHGGVLTPRSSIRAIVRSREKPQ